MNSDMTVTATYYIEYLITVYLYFEESGYPFYYVASGSVLVDGMEPCSGMPVCNYPFPEGQTVTLQAVPDFGSAFGGWEGACEGEPSPTCTVTVGEIGQLTGVAAIFILDP
jgi:hypothetical protein